MMRKGFAWAALLLLAGCGTDRLYQAKHDFEEGRWPPEEQPTFTFDIAEPAQAYDLFYEIRHHRDYPYQNLYVRISVQDSTGSIVKSELQNIVLFDPQTGEPEGSGFGPVLSREIRGLHHYRFPHAGTYTFAVEQRNRDGAAEDIESFGIWVVPGAGK